MLDITKFIGFSPNISNSNAPYFDMETGCFTSIKPKTNFIKTPLKEHFTQLLGMDFDKWDCPVLDEETLQSQHPKVFFGGDSAFGPENIIWASAHAHKAAISIHIHCQGKDLKQYTPLEVVNLISTKI